MFKNSLSNGVSILMKDSSLIEDCIEIYGDGIHIKVEVIPNASKSEISGMNQWRKSIQIRLRSKAEGGKANTELLELLSEVFSIPVSKLSIISGQKYRKKKVKIEGIDSISLINTIKDIMEATV